MSEPRTWVIDAFGQRPLTVNKLNNIHRMAWANRRSATRTEWAGLAQAAGVPRLDAATFTVTPLHKNRATPQDVAACAPEAKAAIDGIVDAGVLDDDDPTRLLAVTFMPPWVCGADGMRIRITEATPHQEGAAA